LACTASEPLIEGQAKHRAVEDLVPDKLPEAAIDQGGDEEMGAGGLVGLARFIREQDPSFRLL
jgi:hypothetical protein